MTLPVVSRRGKVFEMLTVAPETLQQAAMKASVPIAVAASMVPIEFDNVQEKDFFLTFFLIPHLLQARL